MLAALPQVLTLSLQARFAVEAQQGEARADMMEMEAGLEVLLLL